MPGSEYDFINFSAIENFEIRERFRPGQRVVFGITHRTRTRIFRPVVDTADPAPSRPATLRAGAASTPDDASASRRVADVDGVSSDRVLVGVNYFAGWWQPLPNKWNYDPAVGDWRTNYPGRVPLLGEYNTQETMDREIIAAAAHGIDFFLILWSRCWRSSFARVGTNTFGMRCRICHFSEPDLMHAHGQTGGCASRFRLAKNGRRGCGTCERTSIASARWACPCRAVEGSGRSPFTRGTSSERASLLRPLVVKAL
jgi:hypothetical protein